MSGHDQHGERDDSVEQPRRHDISIFESIFRRTWAAFGLMLFAVSWRLWIPQSEFPRIPFFEFLTSTPQPVEWLAITLVVGGLLATIVLQSERGLTVALVVFAVALAILIGINQHRLQPWAWQMLLFAALMACGRKSGSDRWMRLIVISIYLYSAISKFDYQFLHTVGQQFLSELAGFVGASVYDLSDASRVWIVALFPLGELLIGVGLLFQRTRRVAVVFAVLQHASLLLILGPLGLNHQPGVLAWNMWFAIQAVMLFWPADVDVLRQTYIRHSTGAGSTGTGSTDSRHQGAGSTAGLVATLIAAFAIMFPATEAIDVCDHWPAWDLYSPRSSRARIHILATAANDLPEDLQGHLESDGDEIWLRLRIDRWSLATLGVPVYPEDRFQLAVARALDERYRLDRQIRVLLQSDSNRFSGQRQETLLSGTAAIQNAADDFRLNMESIPIP